MSNNPYYDQDTEFVLGFAGSGKSTLLAKRATESTLVLVPTHKAADVLKAKGLSNVYTIHSVLKLVPTINQNFRKKLKHKLKKVGEIDLSQITDIFLDEFSMITTEILDQLMAALPEKCKVTIFGDPFQLPPVDGDPIQPWEPITELTTQYRAKNTELFMKFMSSIKDNTPAPSLKGMPIDCEWTKKFNPDTDRVLCYTNKRMIELNNQVVPPSDSGFYYDEELLMNGLPITMVTKDFLPRIYPTCIVKGQLLTGTQLVKQAEKATDNIAKYRTNLGMYKQMPIDYEDENYLIYYDPDHYATTQRLKGDVEKYQRLVIKTHSLGPETNIPQWCQQNRGKQFVMERGKAWSKYLAHTNYVFSVTRPYCTTVHKAQGSEFSKVFIDTKDIAISRAYNPEMYKRLMYVALSRAKDLTVFI